MSGNRRGTNVQRRILQRSIGYDEEIKKLRQTTPHSLFYRAVVVEVLNDLSDLTDEWIDELKTAISNPTLIETAPRNSVIVRIISGAADRKGASPVVCHPFLPPYLSLPVKPGEQVWIMFENESVSTTLGYWLWRVAETDQVDDVNYTHGDRKFTSHIKKSTSERANGSTNTIPGFPNGTGEADGYSLKGANDYEKIIESSESYKNFTPEPVPRFVKRPGDHVIQGSNNTLIVLGEDRTGTASKSEEKKDAGSIDIVVGRGRTEATAPPVIKNTRENEETDKNTIRTGGVKNPDEGNPDLINDSSRVMVAMKTNGDENLGLSGNYPEAFDTDQATDVRDSSYAIVKSDEVRIVARKNEDVGSIRFVKEGTPGDDQAALLMLSDGSVRVDGKIIYIGRPGGAGPGPNGSEPYIKYSKYESQMSEFIDVISDFMTVFLSSFAIPNPPVVGGPTPALTSMAANTSDGPVGVKTKLLALKSKLEEAKSSRIFGE